MQHGLCRHCSFEFEIINEWFGDSLHTGSNTSILRDHTFSFPVELKDLLTFYFESSTMADKLFYNVETSAEQELTMFRKASTADTLEACQLLLETPDAALEATVSDYTANRLHTLLRQILMATYETKVLMRRVASGDITAGACEALHGKVHDLNTKLMDIGIVKQGVFLDAATSKTLVRNLELRDYAAPMVVFVETKLNELWLLVRNCLQGPAAYELCVHSSGDFNWQLSYAHIFDAHWLREYWNTISSTVAV